MATLPIRRDCQRPNPATPTRSRSRSSRPSPATSRSRSSIGTRCRPTKAWACGATFRSPPPDPSPYDTPSSPRTLSGRARNSRVRAELTNASAAPVEGVLKGRIEKIEFSQAVKLAAHETKIVHLTPAKAERPRLWWPAQVGPQNLYPLDLTFETGGKVSDTSHTEFGIREVTSELDAQGHRLFHINGKNILIRGAGYTFDMLLRSSPERQEAELRYVRDMNLNAVRFEGKLEDDHFLELCDRMGILVLAGWCCCDHWEKWAQVGQGRRDRRGRFPARSTAPSGAPSFGLRLALRQRQSSAAQDRTDLSGRDQGSGVAQPVSIFGHREEDAGRRDRREDDGSLRICRAVLLAARYQGRRRARLQHGDQSRPRAAADREPAPHAARGQALADQRRLGLSRGRRPVQEHQRLHRGAGPSGTGRRNPPRSTRARRR